ncbi:uncharacterized protein LOC143276993 [Babylonia areolata]|uniref:uncharacterized protein LOC143276993 n=1 Tax=Babylonia areolata TaxID=304850 RepID=UPI003FD3A9E8
MSSPRVASGAGRQQWRPSRPEPESTTSAFSSTTSYDSYSEEEPRRDATHSYSDREGGRERTRFLNNVREESRDTTLSYSDREGRETTRFPNNSREESRDTTLSYSDREERETTRFPNNSREESRDTTLSYSEREGAREATRFPNNAKADESRDTTHSRETRDSTYSSRDVTRDSSDTERAATVISAANRKDVTFHSRHGDTSTDTERQGSYDFRYPPPYKEERIEWSCDEAGGWQKLSFMFLVLSFLGHGLAVCTPYWVVGWQGEQMTLYEGVWLSCYRERGEGSWVCSTFDTIRHLFEQPVWYEACQVSAVLSVVLLMPALLVASLYSYVVALRGRSRASWLLIVFLASAAFCSFLSLVVFSAGYPSQQNFPPGKVRYHASFALQVVSLLLCLLSLLGHLRDSYPHLQVWDNKLCGSDNRMPSSCAGMSGRRAAKFRPSGLPGKKTPPPPKGSPKLLPSSLLLSSKVSSALARFRSKGEKNPSAPPLERIEELSDGREATPATVATVAVVGETGVPSPARARGVAAGSEKERATFVNVNDSMSGYDSQV